MLVLLNVVAVSSGTINLELFCVQQCMTIIIKLCKFVTNCKIKRGKKPRFLYFMDKWVQHKAVIPSVLCKNLNVSQKLEMGISVRIIPGDNYNSLLNFGEMDEVVYIFLSVGYIFFCF